MSDTQAGDAAHAAGSICIRQPPLPAMLPAMPAQMGHSHMAMWPHGTATTCTGRLMHTLQSTMARGPSGVSPQPPRGGFTGSSPAAAAADSGGAAAAPAPGATSAAGGGVAPSSAAVSRCSASASAGCCSCCVPLPPWCWQLAAADASPAACPAPLPAAGASGAASPAASAGPAAGESAASRWGAPPAAACSNRSMALCTRRSTSSASTSSSPSAQQASGGQRVSCGARGGREAQAEAWQAEAWQEQENADKQSESRRFGSHLPDSTHRWCLRSPRCRRHRRRCG